MDYDEYISHINYINSLEINYNERALNADLINDEKWTNGEIDPYLYQNLDQ